MKCGKSWNLLGFLKSSFILLNYRSVCDKTTCTICTHVNADLSFSDIRLTQTFLWVYVAVLYVYPFSRWCWIEIRRLLWMIHLFMFDSLYLYQEERLNFSNAQWLKMHLNCTSVCDHHKKDPDQSSVKSDPGNKLLVFLYNFSV